MLLVVHKRYDVPRFLSGFRVFFAGSVISEFRRFMCLKWDFAGAPSRTRTCNRRIRSPLLYPLSHGRASYDRFAWFAHRSSVHFGCNVRLVGRTSHAPKQPQYPSATFSYAATRSIATLSFATVHRIVVCTLRFTQKHTYYSPKER